MRILGLSSLVSIIALAAGCVVETRLDDPQPVYAPSTGDAPKPSDSTSALAPMLVVIDSGKSMDAQPGQGVGVFVEYKQGGSWRVWWTCDTNVTKEVCDVNVRVSAASLVDVDAKGAELPAPPTVVGTSISTSTRTTSQVHALTLRTSPGGEITVDATVGGLRDGNFMFFVQDGKVNGGFEGRLTNPLRFVPQSP